MKTHIPRHDDSSGRLIDSNIFGICQLALKTESNSLISKEYRSRQYSKSNVPHRNEVTRFLLTAPLSLKSIILIQDLRECCTLE